MNNPLRESWHTRSPRERTVIVVAACILVIALYLLLVVSAERARGPLHDNVTLLRMQAARMDQQALDYSHLQAMPSATVSTTDLRSLMREQIDSAGLAGSLIRIDALDANQVVVVFGAVAFADWLDWIDALKSQHVRLDACRIEALSSPGMVSVTATLVRPTPR